MMNNSGVIKAIEILQTLKDIDEFTIGHIFTEDDINNIKGVIQHAIAILEDINDT